MNINDFITMAPMKYYDNPDPKTTSGQKKREDIISNINNLYCATVKHDGYWGLFIHKTRGENSVRSRAISSVTGTYGDYTPSVPHLVKEMDEWPDNTVILGELCVQTNTSSNKVGTILRCLPEKAVQRQAKEEDKVIVWAFDCLMFDGKDLTNTGYLERYAVLRDHFESIYFKITPFYLNDFAETADEIIQNGGEGLVLQRKDNKYYPGERPAWKTLKLKKSLPHLELKVISTIDPNKLYDGIELNTWQYKIDGVAVTKPYFYHWKNGVTVDFRGTAVDVTSGLTDDDRAWLATEEAQKMIRCGDLYAEVKAMEINSQKSLRHPSLVQLRPRSSGANE